MYKHYLYTHKSYKHYIPKRTNIFLLNSDCVFLASRLAQVGRNESAYLELQNATRFNRLRNLTSNFSNTKVRNSSFESDFVKILLVTKLRFFLSPPFKKNDFRKDFRFPSKLRLENFVIILNSLENWPTQPFPFLDILHISLERTPRVFLASLEPALLLLLLLPFLDSKRRSSC